MKELAEAELEEIYGPQRIKALQTIGLAALAVFSASALAFGIYKLYQRCTQPVTKKNGPTKEELDRLPIQFRPKAWLAGRG